MELITAKKANVTQNGMVYKKLNLTDYEKGQLSLWCHKGRSNHVVWDAKHLHSLSDAQYTIRDASRRKSALVIGNGDVVDYFVRV